MKQQALAGDIVLLFADESEALTHPYLARAWAKRGADLRVAAPGPSQKIAMMGALNFVSRQLIVVTSQTKRSAVLSSCRRASRCSKILASLKHAHDRHARRIGARRAFSFKQFKRRIDVHQAAFGGCCSRFVRADDALQFVALGAKRVDDVLFGHRVMIRYDTEIAKLF